MQASSPKAGAPASVDIVLVPKGNYHCNAEYPHKFTFAAAPAGVTYSQPVVRTISITPKRGVMRVPYSAASAGSVTISGKFSFAVCTDDICEPETASLSITVNVD